MLGMLKIYMKNKGKFGNKINKKQKNKVNELKSLGFS